jgi:secreted Zn-dependent insulinase-like peptidase
LQWRTYQLDKATSKPTHPYSKFGTGNSVTLRDEPAAAGVDVRAQLLAFHKTHYSAGRMTLAVLGVEGLDTLEAWARELFGPVVNNGSTKPVFEGHPYPSPDVQYLVPVKDKRSLSVAWALPGQKGDWRAKSAVYISHVMGHEGPGSLLSALRERGWASGLFAGETDGENGFATFGCTVELSPSGLANWECVLDLVHAYVGMLRAVGPVQWVHEEKAALAASSFRFASKRGVFSTVTALARQLPDFPPAQVLTGPSLVWDWDPVGVSALVDLLRPSNCRIRLTAKDAVVADQCKKTEKWYGVVYGAEALSEARAARLTAAAATYESLTAARMAAAGGQPPLGGPAALSSGSPVDAPALAAKVRLGGAAEAEGAADLAPWSTEGLPAALAALYPPLTLPAKNAFIATEFDIRNPGAAARRAAGAEAGAEVPGSVMTPHGVRVRREDAPVLLHSSPGKEVWLVQDAIFGLPKLSVAAAVDLPAAYVSPRAIALLELGVALAKEGLTEVSYAASLAELQYSASVTVSGLDIQLGGFHHRMGALADLVAAALPRIAASNGFSDVTFAVQLDKLRRGYANFTKDAPYLHAARGVSEATTTPRWSTAEKAAGLAATPVTPAELRAFVTSALSSFRLRVLVVGNATPAEAVAIADALHAPLAAGVQPPVTALAGPRVVALPAALTVVLPGGGVSTVTIEALSSRPAPNPEEPNAAMDMIVQVGPGPWGALAEQSALVELMGHIIAEPYFDTLRTKQSLGYIVSAGPRKELGVEGLRFLAQSNRVPAAEVLLDRTNAFLSEFTDLLAAMPADRFAANVRAAAIKCSDADKNLQELTSRLWPEVATGTLQFNRASAEVEALFALTQERVVAWYKAVLAPGGAERRAFVSLIERGSAAGPIAEAPAPAAPVVAPGTTVEAAGEAASAMDASVAATAAAPGAALETLAGGSTGTGATAVPTVAAPLPTVRLPFAGVAGALHVLAVTGHGSGPVPLEELMTALSACVTPALAASLRGALVPEGPAPSSLRIIAEVAQAADVRAMLPLHRDAGAIAKAIRMASFQQRVA